MQWSDCFAETFEQLKLTPNGECITRKRKLKYGGILAYYDSARTGRPRISIFAMKHHEGYGFIPLAPDDYYEPVASASADREDELVQAWNEAGAEKKREAGRKKCEADRAARHNKRRF